MTPVRLPTKATLKRYGLSLEEWAGLLERQGDVCYVCRAVPDSGRLCVDHFHVAKWKRMPPEKRKQYVRGLLCSYCNRRLVAKGMTAVKAQRIADYLGAFDLALASALGS